jgi:hypothetical protein
VTPSTPSLQYLLRIEVHTSEPISAGSTPVGEVRVIHFTGGHFEGPELRGDVLPGGSDWQRVRVDGVLEIRAHYLLQTDRGERVEVISEGMRHAPDGVLARIAAGEAVPPDQYYFRTCVRFHTGAERLSHLNRLLALTFGRRSKSGVELDVFAVP